MTELTSRESQELAALLATVARPHSPQEAAAVEAWIHRLSRAPLPTLHGRDLLAE